MSHRVVIINSVVIPSGPSASASEAPEMTAEITYRPTDTASTQDISKMVGRVLKRLEKLADDGAD